MGAAGEESQVRERETAHPGRPWRACTTRVGRFCVGAWAGPAVGTCEVE